MREPGTPQSLDQLLLGQLPTPTARAHAVLAAILADGVPTAATIERHREAIAALSPPEQGLVSCGLAARHAWDAYRAVFPSDSPDPPAVPPPPPPSGQLLVDEIASEARRLGWSGSHQPIPGVALRRYQARMRELPQGEWPRVARYLAELSGRPTDEIVAGSAAAEEAPAAADRGGWDRFTDGGFVPHAQ